MNCTVAFINCFCPLLSLPAGHKAAWQIHQRTLQKQFLNLTLQFILSLSEGESEHRAEEGARRLTEDEVSLEGGGDHVVVIVSWRES